MAEVYRIVNGQRQYAGYVQYNTENNSVRYGGGGGSNNYGNRMRVLPAVTGRRSYAAQQARRGRRA